MIYDVWLKVRIVCGNEQQLLSFFITTSINLSVCMSVTGEYLNDNLVDFYIKFMLLEDNLNLNPRYDAEKAKEFYAFNCLFFTKLMGQSLPLTECYYNKYKLPHYRPQFRFDYPAVEKWTNNVDLFSKKVLLLPINKNFHWSIFVIYRPDLLVSLVLYVCCV